MSFIDFFRSKLTIAPRDRVSVRMEAIGGQGANSAGKILAEAAVLGMGFTGNHFSSFGSEKRGSHVRSFVRFSILGEAVRSAAFIRVPDVLLIFHESLIATHPECLEGVSESTDVLINSDKSPGKIAFPQGFRARRIATIDALSLAQKADCGLNAVMLGAASIFCPEIKRETLEAALEQFFARLSEKVREANRLGFAKGLDAIATRIFESRQAKLVSGHEILPRLGWANAPIGGLIANPGNTVLKDNSASRRGVAPRFIQELCFNCGRCDMVCPDFCFVWDLSGETPALQGVDYQYCKGCQKCVLACPVEALVAVPESEISVEQRAKKLFPRGKSKAPEGDE